jgi:hypothetical protein
MNPGPPPSLPKRSDLRWGVAAATVVAGLFLSLGLFLFLSSPVVCAGCPGPTPPGTALMVGNGTGGCATGNGSPPDDCDYTFPIRISGVNDGSPPLSGRDLSFELETPNGNLLGAPFDVTLVASSGCGVGTWNSTTSNWGPSTGPGQCGTPDSTLGPIGANESFVLTPAFVGGLPFFEPGDQFLVLATGGGYSGEVTSGLG